jgi:hypothetical protein
MTKVAAMRKKHAAKYPINVNAPIKLDLEDSDESSESEDDETPACKKKGRRSLCNVSMMGNCDLSNFFNGYPGDSLENRPLDYTFTKESIINFWIAESL